MKYTNKMLLVPYNKVNKIQPIHSQIHDLDKQMSLILNSNSLPLDRKVKLYNQILSKYIKANESSIIDPNRLIFELKSKFEEILEKMKNQQQQQPSSNEHVDSQTNTTNELESVKPSLWSTPKSSRILTHEPTETYNRFNSLNDQTNTSINQTKGAETDNGFIPSNHHEDLMDVFEKDIFEPNVLNQPPSSNTRSQQPQATLEM
jgi:type II secretory pathway component HofQ